MRRVRAAIDFIEANLEDELPLDRVAEAVGLSRYHLQRLFRAVYGDNLKAYIRKRRLTVAAGRLADGNERIIEIALASGFESQEAFSRSFRALFGCNPGEYRKNPDRRFLPGLFKPSADSIEHRHAGLSFEPQIVELTKGFDVVGIGAGIDFEDDVHVAGIWRRLFAALEADAPDRLSPQLPLCGVAQADHPDIRRAPGHCLAYVAGPEEDLTGRLNVALTRAAVPDGLYAVFEHQGSFERIPETVNYAWGSWLGRGGYRKSERPDLERLTFGAIGSERPVMHFWMSIE